jgi:glutathione synthase
MMDVGVIMDPIQDINILKDTTFALLREAERRNFKLFYMEQHYLFLKNNIAFGKMYPLHVIDHAKQWFTLGAPITQELSQLKLILMRKDPPVDIEYLMTTHILEQAETQGVAIINKPQSLRDANEKLFTAWFPQCCPPTLVSAQQQLLAQFLSEHQDIIIKPLHGMGGTSVFRLKLADPNINVVFETLTQKGKCYVMAQRYIPAITTQGDKRIIVIGGIPIPYALARKPLLGETRANLAAGGQGMGVTLTARDQWICEQVGPILQRKGLHLVGLDIIGDYLTEINVTSPTCIREIEAAFSINICGQFWDYILQSLAVNLP